MSTITQTVHYRSARNSLLGIDEETNKRLLYAEETEDTYDRENEQSVADLEHKVKQMKKVFEIRHKKKKKIYL